MALIPNTRKLLVLALGLTLYGLPQTGRADPDRVNFDTIDGVKIEGVFYPSTKGQKAPVAILLHDFDNAGGTCKTEGFDSLAKELQKRDFAVLAFDFRGFGQSTGVDPSFWMAPHNIKAFGNKAALIAAGRAPKAIGYKQFPGAYFANLVNDVAAAKAYLDTRNDAGDLNSRNVLVIGAGRGATLGLMWMATEYKRQKGVVNNALGRPMLTALVPGTAGEDLMGGIWLSPNPSVGGHFMPVGTWLREVGRQQKLPMAFVYGKDETGADQRALGYLKTIYPDFVRGNKIKDKDLAFTGEKAIPGTKLSGAKLLQSTLGTEDFIVKEYVEPLLKEKHRFVPWKVFNNDDNYFYWKPASGLPVLAKDKGQKAPMIVPRPIADLPQTP